jgi:hypothetical protein
MARDPRAQDSATPSGRRRLVLPALVLVAAVVVAIAGWSVLDGGDDEEARGGRTAPAASSSSASVDSPAASGTSTPAARPGGRPSPSTAGPGRAASPSSGGKAATPTPEVAPRGTPQRTLRTALGRSRQLGNGVAVDVVEVESVRGKGRGVGEVSGPAVRLTVEVRNRTGRSLPLDLALVTVYYGGQDTPASELSGPGVRRLPPRLAENGTATGTYVFAVPRGSRGDVRVDFTYSTRAPRVVFRGAADGTA